MLNHRENNDLDFKEKIREIHVGDNLFIDSNSTIIFDVNVGAM